MVYWRILLASLLLVHEWYDLIIAFEGGDGKGGGVHGTPNAKLISPSPRFCSTKNAAGAKLERTSLSAGVFRGAP